MKSLIGELSISEVIDPTVKERADKLLTNIFKLLGKSLILKYLNISEEDIESITGGVSKTVISDYKEYSDFVKDFKENLSKDENLKLILIDELDRCRPEYAIELLETVKHFFGVKNIIFIFLVNMEQMKSIVSTSYLTEDKCSEYFEKFYDIKFKLPGIDYNDFMEIEYSKYQEAETYNCYEDKGYLFSNETDRYYESLFLEMVESNSVGSNISPRYFIKSFKKFKLLLSSLNLEEKQNYALMIILMLYFIKKEFFENVGISLEKLHFKTFFDLNDINTDISTINERNIYEKVKLKDRYSSKGSNFYILLYFILLYKKGKEKYDENSNYSRLSYCISFTQTNGNKRYTIFSKLLSQRIIILNNIGAYFDNFSISKIYFDTSLLNGEMKKYYIKGYADELLYNIKALEIWCENKYNFILN